MKTHGRIRLALGLFFCLQFFPRSTVGATVSWVGQSGDRNTAINGNGGVLPGTSHDVVIVPGMLLRNRNKTVGYDNDWDGALNMTVINQGVIASAQFSQIKINQT